MMSLSCPLCSVRPLRPQPTMTAPRLFFGSNYKALSSSFDLRVEFATILASPQAQDATITLLQVTSSITEFNAQETPINEVPTSATLECPNFINMTSSSISEDPWWPAALMACISSLHASCHGSSTPS